MNIKLENCPFCCGPVRLTVIYSPVTREPEYYEIRCAYMGQEYLDRAYFMPAPSEKLEDAVAAWNDRS